MKTIACPVCSMPLDTRMARGRRTNKPFLMLVCPKDGRHLRGFISDKEFVASVIDKAEAQTKSTGKTGTEGEVAP